MDRRELDQITIAAPPDRVWPFLVEPRTWTTWWPAVTSARSADFKPLREGSALEINLDLARFRPTVRGRVTFLTEHRSFTWSASWLGVPMRQEWYLAARPEGTRASVRTTFTGVGAAVIALFRFNRLWADMGRQQLRGLKRIVERAG